MRVSVNNPSLETRRRAAIRAAGVPLEHAEARIVYRENRGRIPFDVWEIAEKIVYGSLFVDRVEVAYPGIPAAREFGHPSHREN